MKTKIFPPEFLFGTATASLQIEGGDTNNTWFRWSEQGRIKDGSHSKRACDHWKRIESDLALHKGIGAQTYRLGVEWSRIEPQPGRFSEEAIAVYRSELEGLVAAGIRPLVTLYHFSLPLWFEDSGGWNQEASPEIFVRFVKKTVWGLGDLVRDWVTINEPNIYLAKGWILAEWPPGKRDAVPEMYEAARNLVRAHVLAYRAIHELQNEGEKPRVGVAHHLRIFQAACCPLSWVSAYLHDRVFQGIFLESMTTGRWLAPLGKGYPMGSGPFADFLGVNYYTRDMVYGKLSAKPLLGILRYKKGAPANDLGWEIYPQGLKRLIRRVYQRYRLPVWITENGICAADDKKRTDYLRTHLQMVLDCLGDGIPVERYYYWTLMDNFEWIEGEAAPFGLYRNNFDTQERTLRDSGRYFSQIVKTRRL